MHLPSEVVKRSIPEQRCPKLLFPWSIASLSLGFFYFCLFKISPGTWQVCWAFLQKRKLQSYSQASVCSRCGVCVRSHLFAVCVMIQWDEPLSGHFVMPLEMRLTIFFQKSGIGHSEPKWYNLRLSWWSLFQHTDAITEISIKRS